jgi:hypothetical protein
MFFFLCSFLADYQMVLDAQIRVTVTKDGPDNTTITSEEILAPSRHRITLPLNGLNILFNDCTVSFNHHLKLDSDRSVLRFFFHLFSSFPPPLLSLASLCSLSLEKRMTQHTGSPPPQRVCGQKVVKEGDPNVGEWGKD